MQVTWVIERYIFNNNDNYQNELDLIEEVKRQGHLVIELDPFKINPALINFNVTYDLEGPVIFRGSLNTGKLINYSVPHWTPGNICSVPEFKCSTYYTYWGEYMLNNNYTLLPLREAIRLKRNLGELYGGDYNNQVFIRPNSGMKQFTGQVIQLNELNKLDDLHPELLVLIAPVKEVNNEARFVVSTTKDNQGYIVTSCHYYKNRKYIKPE